MGEMHKSIYNDDYSTTYQDQPAHQLRPSSLSLFIQGEWANVWGVASEAKASQEAGEATSTSASEEANSKKAAEEATARNAAEEGKL